jgi:hypothetical protein
VCVDIPKTWSAADSVAKLEGVITALNAHIGTSRALDTGSQRQIADAMQALAEIHAGQSMHDVQFKIALSAPDTATLKRRVDEVRSRLKPFMGVRIEIGEAQIKGARYFSNVETSRLEARPTTWPMLSNALALTTGFLGMRKLQPRPGIIRGINVGGGYPYIYDDWEMSRGKKATHECKAGTTGTGKTFALNCFEPRWRTTAFDLRTHGTWAVAGSFQHRAFYLCPPPA